MENGLNLMYIAFGVILFVSALSALIIMDSGFSSSYDEILYKNIDSSIVYDRRQ